GCKPALRALPGSRPQLTSTFSPLRERGRLIEPFVFGIERRHGDVDDSELADGAVPAARLDVNGRHRFDREELSVQFHLPFAFEYEVNLGHFLVIMRLGVLLNVHEM